MSDIATATPTRTPTPTRALANGVEMPVLGCGVFQTLPEKTLRCVHEAFEIGYRMVDTAQPYANEEEVGTSLRDSGLTRENVFLTTKIAPVNLTQERAVTSINESLHLLGTDYTDLMLLHRPIVDFLGTHHALGETYRASKLRAVGVSDSYPDHLANVALLTEIPPMISQVETHPFRQNAEAHEFITSLGMAYEAWTPFAEDKNSIFTDPVLTAIGTEHGKIAGQMTLRVLIRQDVIVIPKPMHRARMEENPGVFDSSLDEGDMITLAVLDDGSFPRIFDHHDPKMIAWLINERIRKADPSGAVLY